jgi:hypothetical protein
VKSWEWKFVVSRPVADAFLVAVEPRMRPEIHDPERPVCYTRTTYLDTPDLAYLRSGESGTDRRLRVREYASATHAGGVALISGDPWLELKESGGNVRTKVRWRAPTALIAELIARGEIHADYELPRELESLRRALQDAPSPRLTTWYRREPRKSEDGQVRITVDAGLAFAHPEPIAERGTPAKPSRIVQRFGSRILEVKYSGDPPSWLVEAMALLPRPTNFSKFRAGMLAVANAAAEVSIEGEAS